MNTDKMIPTDYAIKTTELVIDDVIYNSETDETFKIDGRGNQLENFNKPTRPAPSFFVVSFADRPNTGTQPVDDGVRVDVTYTQGSSFEDIDAGSLKWLAEDTESYCATKSWKPNHAAMLAKYQSGQGAKQMKYAEQETELATHYSANNNSFYRQCNSINRKSMVLDDAGRWIYSDCTTNGELDGPEFFALDQGNHKEEAHHIAIQIEKLGNQSGLDIVISPDEPAKAGDDKPVFTQAMSDAGEFPPIGSIGVYSLGKGEVLKTRINGTGDKVIVVMHLESHKITWMPVRHLKPIDNRTDNQKLRDLMLGVFVDDGDINDDKLNVESLLSSDKFTITLK